MISLALQCYKFISEGFIKQLYALVEHIQNLAIAYRHLLTCIVYDTLHYHITKLRYETLHNTTDLTDEIPTVKNNNLRWKSFLPRASLPSTSGSTL